MAITHLCYEENPVRQGGGPRGSYLEMDAVKHWIRHMGNFYYLRFIETNPLADRSEVWMARREIPICERKLEYWKKHPNWDAETAARENEKLKKIWASAMTSNPKPGV